MPRPPNDPNLLPAECRQGLIFSMRRTVSQRDKVGFWFDGLPPRSVSGGFRIHTGHTRAEE